MADYVELDEDIMDIVRREARKQGRSIDDQISHWAQIGRAIDKSPDFDDARVASILEKAEQSAEAKEV
jgi:hypothetical protein